MRRIPLFFALILGTLAWPLAVLAAPSNVTGLTAHLTSGQITMHWDAPAGETDIAGYRIYYSQRSILNNGGAYDDFVTTSGKNTDFFFENAPPYPQVFLSVLAIDGAGNESPSFVEEVQLDLAAADTSGQKSQSSDNGLGSPSPSRRQHESTTLGLLGVQALSSTSIQLSFNLPVHIPVEKAATAFAAIDSQGNFLALGKIVIEGSTVTLTTEPQKLDMQYGVRVDDVVVAEPIPGKFLPLDSNRNLAAFTGYNGPGATPPVVKLPPPPKMTPPPAPPKAPSIPAPKPQAGVVGAEVAAAILAPPSITTPKTSALFHSGPEVLAVILVGGAIAGWKKSRKSKVLPMA